MSMPKRNNNPLPSDDRLMNARDVAEYFKVHVTTVERWSVTGKIPSVTFGSPQRPTVRYRKSELDQAMVQRNPVTQNHVSAQ